MGAELGMEEELKLGFEKIGGGAFAGTDIIDRGLSSTREECVALGNVCK